MQTWLKIVLMITAQICMIAPFTGRVSFWFFAAGMVIWIATPSFEWEKRLIARIMGRKK